MRSDTVKGLSYLAFWAGAASVVASGVMYLTSRLGQEKRQANNSLFVGLWAPSLFALSEMLDRIAVEDDRYMGVTIDRDMAGVEQGRDLIERGRDLIRR